MQGIAVGLVTLMTVAIVAVLVSSRHASSPVGKPTASGARLGSPTPSPVVLPSTAQVSAPSSNVVWALVDQRRLFRSTDKGDTWQERSLPSHAGGGGQPSISFVDDQLGWMLFPGVPETQCNGAGAELWRTVDGGRNWQQAALVDHQSHAAGGLGYAQCKEYVSFVHSTLGFVTAWDDNHPPTIYRTADGGRTWSASTLPDPPDFKTQAGGVELRAGLVKRFGNTLLVDAWSQDRQYIFRSTDGGATWSWLTKVPSRYVVMATASRWLQYAPEWMESTNAGQQWHPFQSDYSQAAPVAPVVAFGGPSVGYATVRGGIQRTSDGGSHWVPIETPGTIATPRTHTPLPAQTANWPSFSSPDYGYSLRYPPRWFDQGSAGVSTEQYFSNKKANTSPLNMGPDDVLVGVSAGCHYGIGPSTEISEETIVVDAVSAVRYFVEGTGGQDGPFFSAIATIEPGDLCYRIYMFAWTQKAIEANLADFDLMLESVRFSPQ
jgi:photosystem II stability/assembly factor-like uncharacterized protein